jgi:hypothetical protein
MIAQRANFGMIVGIISLGGCATTPMMTAHEVTQASASMPSAPRLTESLFHKPADRDNLSEEVIARILNSPIELEFPARVGVVALDHPFSSSAYATLEPGEEAPQILAQDMEKSRHFVMVSDISPYLAEGQSIESLRELATRYRLKYLVIFNARFADQSHVNSWGWGWISVLGIPFVPAYTLQTAGLLEATLLDVRTGTFLFTTQIHLSAMASTTPFSTEDKLKHLQQEASRKAVRLLASKFLTKCNRLAVKRGGGPAKGSSAGALSRQASQPKPGPAASSVTGPVTNPERAPDASAPDGA